MGKIKNKILEERKNNFIRKAKDIFGDFYGYSKVVYKNSTSKVTIICPVHGEFQQTPSNHITSKCPCLKCSYIQRGKDKTKTLEQFISDAKKVHGDKYDYSFVEYKGNNEYIKIKCNKCCNIFRQTPSSHLAGSGCPYCGRERTLQSTRMTLEEFTRRSKEKFGDDTFDYSNVKYKNNSTKIILKCNKCGYIFEQEPFLHLNGLGCPKCNHQIKVTAEEFINRAKKIHGDLYDYSKVEFKTLRTNVIIHCNRCGKDFLQKPIKHLQGHGCIHCSRSHMEEAMSIALKENKINFEEQKMFDWMGKQKLDFFLPDYNIAIECQGGQHYQSVKIFGGEKGLLKRKVLDNRKKKLCKENGVNIIYYSNVNYTDDIITDKESLIKLLND